MNETSDKKLEIYQRWNPGTLVKVNHDIIDKIAKSIVEEIRNDSRAKGHE